MIPEVDNKRLSFKELDPPIRDQFAESLIKAYDKNGNNKIDKHELLISLVLNDSKNIEDLTNKNIDEQKTIFTKHKQLDKPELKIHPDFFEMINNNIVKPNFTVDPNGAIAIVPEVYENLLLQIEIPKINVTNLEMLPSDPSQYCKEIDTDQDAAFDEDELKNLYDCFFEKAKPTSVFGATNELIFTALYSNFVKYAVTKGNELLLDNPPAISNRINPYSAVNIAAQEFSKKVANYVDIGIHSDLKVICEGLANERNNLRFYGDIVDPQ